MRKVILFAEASLDGFFEGPNKEIDFETSNCTEAGLRYRRRGEARVHGPGEVRRADGR